MDIHMPDVNGIEATRRIVEEFPGTKVVAFSMHSDRQFVVGAIKAGVSGYLLKDCAFEELAHARGMQENRPAGKDQQFLPLNRVIKNSKELGTFVQKLLGQMF
jgi:DNA-binding NarL/FixJ family response regulator